MPEQVGQVISVADALREARGLSHMDFVAALGRDLTEWSHLRAGRRDPSPTFVRALREYAAGIGDVWPSRVDVAIQSDALARVA